MKSSEEWTFREGTDKTWPITYSYDYLIAHQDDKFVVSHRSTGSFLGDSKNLSEAQAIAEKHKEQA
jgi:hypothetical protein